MPLEDRLVLSPPGSGWQLQWSDEFNGTSLDLSKWTVFTGPRRDAVNTADAISVSGGYLTITTYTSGGTNYTGFIGTPNTFLGTYGYWEARINFQDSPGEWSAFWDESPTIGNPLGNPAVAGTEIDTIEHRYTDGTNDISNKAESNLHWDGYGSNEKSTGSGLKDNPSGTSLQGNFHLYGLQWGPGGYQFYIDGIQIWSTTQAVSQRSEYIFLTSEVQNHSWAGNIPSGGYGSLTTSKTKLIVDYVRIYEQVPTDWATTDIGNPGILGSASFIAATGTWTVAGSGADIWGMSDQFHLASETWVGDGRIMAQVNSMFQNTNPWAKAGVMFRDSADPGSPFADVLATPGNGVAFEWRATPGSVPSNVNVTGLSTPVWVQLVRSGDAFSGFYSGDGVTWTQIGATQTVAMSSTTLAGLAVTSHNVNASITAAFSHVSVLPVTWTARDIGGPGLPGSSVLDPPAGIWTVAGGGTDIWGTADQFQFASQNFTGDGRLTARVTGVPNTNAWAKAGVMFRDSTDPGALFADVVATPGNGVAFQWRSTSGAVPNNVNVTGLTAPVWVRLVRSGNAFSGFYSTDGVTWTQIGTTQTIAMSPTALAGLAVTAHNNAALTAATFTHVSLLPVAWSDADIGSPGRPGYADYDPASGTWTVTGGGTDIWGTADQFHFASRHFARDGRITALVTSVQNTNSWAKAGVMIRDSADPGAPFADVLATPGQGVSFQWRSTAGANASSITLPGVTAPVWVRLTRKGQKVRAFYSTDGSTWNLIGTPQAIALSPRALAGLAVTAHNNAVLAAATFTNVSALLTGWARPATAGDGNASAFNQTFAGGVTLFTPGDETVTGTDTLSVITSSATANVTAASATPGTDGTSARLESVPVDGFFLANREDQQQDPAFDLVPA
jgi:beta-glucanase (GH16 family)/regulation of enolase protein 1 (concanavalin A-like superfamily)